MRIEIFVLLLATATALAGTHVNISFTQQHSRTGSKISELENGQLRLKSTDSLDGSNNENKNTRFARIQVDGNKSNVEVDNSQKVDSDLKPHYEVTADYRSERVKSEERPGFFGSHSQNQQRTFYNPSREVSQNNGQFKSFSPQDMKNMEFERYIQNYHSGPTVETVYESAKPEMQHTLGASSVQESSQRVVKFERQVALITNAENVKSSADVTKPTVSHQPATPSNTISLGSISSSSTPSSSLAPVIPDISVSSTAGNNFNVNLNQKPSSAGKDGFNFDLNYNKPNYNDPTFKYNNDHADSHFFNQFPPSVEEPRSSYGDYYNMYNRQQAMDSYHPSEQRPVVTKTIQIAQPAIKAKKYEVRHPAIQKEFYDIEERVVIKPAGTVVVELERPSAKILKEETTLPLGHPHPAVAGAYMQNRNTQTFGNIIYSNAGSSSTGHPNNQYLPHQTFNNKNVLDHHSATASSVSTSTTSKEVRPEPSQIKPYIGESHFSAASTLDTQKPQNREIVVLTDGHGNQRQLPTDQFTYSRDETNKSPSRTVYNHRNSFAYEDNGRTSAQANMTPQRSGFQANLDNREDFTLDAEYINNSGNTNLRKESKPARLVEASAERVVEQKQQPQPIIKHEHKIVLSPSQHNIYLSRNQEVPKSQFIEETGEVREVKPYLKNHRGPVVVYAPTKRVQDFKYVQRSEYNPSARISSQVVQNHNSPQRTQLSDTDNRVQYSAPYAQMRHHSDEERNEGEQKHQTHHFSSQLKSEQLVLEDKPVTDVKKSSNEKSTEKEAPQAHIELTIPNTLKGNDNKDIFIGSTIRPMMMDDDSNQSQNSKLEISITNNGEPKQAKTLEDELDTNDEKDIDDENKSEVLASIKTKPDCDQTSKSVSSENYELASKRSNYRQQKFMRIVEGPSASSSDASSSEEPAAVQSNLQPHNIDVNHESTAGHLSPAGSRVIASTAAPKESNPRESFHKRRIVVNHPFQTVREVVEHEPYTNYHEVQVHEPATPALYHSANYYQHHGALRQSENHKSPAYYP